MPLVISKKNTIKHRAVFVEPTDMGREKRHDLVIEFKIRARSSAEQVMKDLRHGAVSDLEVYLEDIVNIDGLLDVDGSEIPYTPNMLEGLLDVTWVMRGMSKAWMEVQLGRDILREKN